MSDQILRALGHIEGKLDLIQDSLTKVAEKQDAIEDRVCRIEVRSAGIGGVAALVIAAGVEVAKAHLSGVV